MTAGGGPGFVFWGLFVTCGLVAAAYAAWILWVERERPRDPRR